jgi:DNA-binding response OmpR family regulator
VTTELTPLSRVAYRGREITRPRQRGLLALLAGDLRRGCSTARLVEGLWPEELPDHPAKALQVVVSRARAQLGAGDELADPVSALRAERASTRNLQVDAVQHDLLAERLAQPGRRDRRLGSGGGHPRLTR